VIATHNASAAARSLARRTATSDTTPAATAATAATASTGQQAPAPRHSDPDARSHHSMGSVPASHNNDSTGDSTLPQPLATDHNPSRETTEGPDTASTPETALAALITATQQSTNDPPHK
jgi:hypothetical protein